MDIWELFLKLNNPPPLVLNSLDDSFFISPFKNPFWLFWLNNPPAFPNNKEPWLLFWLIFPNKEVFVLLLKLNVVPNKGALFLELKKGFPFPNNPPPLPLSLFLFSENRELEIESLFILLSFLNRFSNTFVFSSLFFLFFSLFESKVIIFWNIFPLLFSLSPILSNKLFMIPFFFSSKSFLFIILSDSNSKDSFLLSSFCKLLIFPSMLSLLNSGSISISTSFGLSWIFGLLLSLLSFISLIISFFSLKPNIILSLGNGWYDAWYSLFIPNLTFLSLILLFSVLSSSFFSLSIPNLIFSPVNGI